VSVTGEVVTAGASWIYPYSHPTNGGSVAFHAASFTFGAGGGINAAGLGYKGGDKVNCRGYGPGGGWASNTSGGGSYGGLGGSPNATSRVYGDYRAPIDPGSGGGSGQTPGGGAGGGAVLLETTGAIRVDGSILADAPTISGNYLSAGSGGGIYLQCRVLRGTGGVVSANGGSFSHTGKGGGGGGRIAVVYDVEEQDQEPLPAIRFSTLPGSGTVSLMGDVGTLFFPDNRLLTGQTGFIVHSGTWLSDEPLTTWSADRLVISNAWLRLPLGGLSINVAGAVVVTGADPAIHKLDITNATVNCASLSVEKSVGLVVRGGITDGQQGVYGAAVNVSGDMTLGPNAWVYPLSHPTNGGSPVFRVHNLSIAATGGFDASSGGFAGGAINGNGYGPGAGAYLGSGSGGGGHGGTGGRTTGLYGLSYGFAKAPFQPGSGAGGGPNGPGGRGGGVIRIIARDTVLLNGSIFAKGQYYTYFRSGAGGGGGIFVTCRDFAGAGVLNADGGNAHTGVNDGMGGGGGRIAVWHGFARADDHEARVAEGGRRGIASSAPAAFTGTASVLGGTGSYSWSPQAQPGSVVFLTAPPQQSMIVVR
jgi:hypothetical protein